MEDHIPIRPGRSLLLGRKTWIWYSLKITPLWYLQDVCFLNIELSFYQVKKFYRVSCIAEKIEDAKGAKAKPSSQKPSRERSENSEKTQVMEAGAQVQNTITKLKILKSC